MLLSWCIRCSAWHSQATPCCPTLKVPGILSPPWRAGPKRPNKVTQALSDRSTPTTTQRREKHKKIYYGIFFFKVGISTDCYHCQIQNKVFASLLKLLYCKKFRVNNTALFQQTRGKLHHGNSSLVLIIWYHLNTLNSLDEYAGN